MVLTKTSRSGTLPRRILSVSGGKYLVSGDVDNTDPDQYVQSIGANGTAEASIGGAAFVKADFGSVDRFADQVTDESGNLIQLASTGNVSLTFTGLGTFTGSPDYSLVRINPTTGFVANSHKKFRFSSVNFTIAGKLQKDPQGRFVVLSYEGTANQRSAKLSRHLASDFALDATFGTAGVYTIHNLNFLSQESVPDFYIDEQGFYYTLTNLNTIASGGSQVGFRFTKMNESLTPVNNFGNGIILPGTYELMGTSADGISASRIVKIPDGFVLVGSRNSVQTLFRLNANGNSLTETALTGFRTVGQVVPFGNGGLLVAGVNTNNRIILALVLPNGTLDPAFNTSGLLTDNLLPGDATVRDLHIDAQCRIVVLAQAARPTGDGDQSALLRFVPVTSNLDLLQSESPDKLQVYPNPAEERLFWPASEQGLLQVFNAQGQLVRRVDNALGNNGLSLIGLPPGTYHLQLLKGRMVQKATFVKH